MDVSTFRSTQTHVEVDTGPTLIELLDQHKATSGLLEPQGHETTMHPPVFTGYDDEDVRALEVNSRVVGDEESKPSTAAFWKGLPLSALTWELLSILLSACFLALGACISALKDKPESAWSRRVVQATLVTPSLWPIVFSGVLGNAIKPLADWRVERGVSLQALEQLWGSLTTAGSVITIFRWSILRMSSVVLILLWAFNPLGSQASFRGIYLQPKSGSSQGHITFYNANLSTQLFLTTFSAGSTRMKPTIRALYSSTLYDFASSTQYVNPTNSTAKDIVSVLGGESSAGIQVASDNWGNVRIPNLRYLSNYDSKDPHKWVTTPWDKTVLNYSSLLGDRVEGVSRTFVGNTTFTIMSSYQQFSCSPWFYLNASIPGAFSGTYLNNTEAGVWLLRNTGRNYIENVVSTTNELSISRTLFITFPFPNMTTPANTSEIIFASRNGEKEVL
ncbi:hypothetical protein BDV96DRAFT_640160 [Lophiotrema nucula]|uniref:Uncharacterized protein n=1 Tax=Lophiotrema nucula TaxID=690887 RepID=A0A6A5ZSP9_9PLEO|nr:hypothetical protein BDV96DRAFT_640160 [Lophiotrema nucula]